MNKKIFAVLIALAVVMIGCAYATDSTDSSNNNTVTISGMNFTIPDGFSEDISEGVVNESGSDDGYNYVSSSKSFESEDGAVVITVATYDQNMTDDIIDDIGQKTTIGNVTGYGEDMGIFSIFSYVQGDKVVAISANNRQIIEDVLS